MLKDGLDVYLPLVDGDAIDAVVKTDGSFVEVQIKARSRDCIFGCAALFAAMTHDHRHGYWFVFYSERIDTIWLLSSQEFLKESVQNKTGKNAGRRSIGFNGKNTKEQSEYCRPQYQKYVVRNFDRILRESPDVYDPLL